MVLHRNERIKVTNRAALELNQASNSALYKWKKKCNNKYLFTKILYEIEFPLNFTKFLKLREIAIFC